MGAEEDTGGPGGGVNSEDTPTTVVGQLPETRRDLLVRSVFGEVGDQEDVGVGGLLERERTECSIPDMTQPSIHAYHNMHSIVVPK